MKRIPPKEPFKECGTCDNIGDCPAPNVDDDGFGTPLPPDVCLKPITVIKNTMKKKNRNEHKI